MAKERKIQANIKAAAEARGAMVLKQNMGGRSGAGIPDLVVCYRGRFVAFEVKRSSSEAATPAQWFKISRIRKAGGIAEVADSVEDAMEALDRVDLYMDKERRRIAGKAKE